MEKGDLVYFYTSFASWQKEYIDRNPGIILASKNPKRNHSYDKGSAYVLWANGEMTKEHLSYLKAAE